MTGLPQHMPTMQLLAARQQVRLWLTPMLQRVQLTKQGRQQQQRGQGRACTHRCTYPWHALRLGYTCTKRVLGTCLAAA